VVEDVYFHNDYGRQRHRDTEKNLYLFSSVPLRLCGLSQ
jgi:hypothetical protein